MANRQCNGWSKEKGQTMIYKTLHRKQDWTTRTTLRRAWKYQRGNKNPYRRRTDNTMAKRKSNGGDHKIFEVMTSTLPKGTLGSVASLLAATLYQGNPDRNHTLWNIVSSERYILHMQVLLECYYIWMESSQWDVI